MLRLLIVRADDEYDLSAASPAGAKKRRRVIHVPSDTGPYDVTRPAVDDGKARVEDDDVINDLSV